MTIPKFWLDLLSVQSTTYDTDLMVSHVSNICRERGYDVSVDKYGNLYVVKGIADLYPCVVAHLDTVHDIIEGGHDLTPLVSPCGKIITGFDFYNVKQSGIGGDDKCGIIAALETMDTLDVCKAFFPLDEEHGCIGTREAESSFFLDVSLLIQADRKGNKDFVTHICGQSIASQEFHSIAEPIANAHGYALNNGGGITDVGELVHSGIAKVSAVNLSAGYYRPHMEDEFIYLPDLRNVIALMISLARQMGGKQWAFRAKKKKAFTRMSYNRWAEVKAAEVTRDDAEKYAGPFEPVADGDNVNEAIQAACDNGDFEQAKDLCDYYGVPWPKFR